MADLIDNANVLVFNANANINLISLEFAESTRKAI